MMYLIYLKGTVLLQKIVKKNCKKIRWHYYYIKNYEKLIKFLNSESEYVQWVELTDLISSVNKKIV